MNRSLAIAAAVTPLAAAAQPEFVTIGDPGNAGHPTDPFNSEPQFYQSRGAVPYRYRMAKTELTWGDWVEFRDAVDASSVVIPGMSRGSYQGNLPFGGDLVVPGSTFNDLPVAGISWRAAAAYCNWLHNGKSSQPEAFLDGAYDFATFGYDQSTDTYTDQATRSPGARFWIPSIDEWLKAVHYDPNRHGQGQGGWWTYADSSDTRPVTGLPGEGETNAYLQAQIGGTAWDIAVGAYPETQTPWGLLDATGGVTELLEGWIWPGEPYERPVDGSSIDGTINPFGNKPGEIFDFDHINRAGLYAEPDRASFRHGLRIAAAIPSPMTAAPLTLALGIAPRRRR
ncbi:MAG: SUMF1/EgtB/PvdO family nonheme iron enzyme [Planctomycetota bacterium]